MCKFTIILNCWDESNYFITGIAGESLVYSNYISTINKEEVYYLVSACVDSFFETEPSIYIEAEKAEFNKLVDFFGKYFNDVTHLYQSVKTVATSLSENKIIDFNCVLLLEYIKTIK